MSIAILLLVATIGVWEMASVRDWIAGSNWSVVHWGVGHKWCVCDKAGIVGVISAADVRLAVGCVDGFAIR